MSSRTTFSLKRWLKRFIPTGSGYADSSNLDAAGLPLHGILAFVSPAMNISGDFESKLELVSLALQRLQTLDNVASIPGIAYFQVSTCSFAVQHL